MDIRGSAIRRARRSSSITASSSQFESQAATLRVVEGILAHRLSASAVLAWIIVPFHSKRERLIPKTPLLSKLRGMNCRILTAATTGL